MNWTLILIQVVKVIAVFAVLLTCCAWMTWLERKLVARIQTRLGPMNTGYQGLLQPVADMIKLIFKEDITPGHVDKWIYNLAPLAAFIPATLSIAVVPFGDSITLFGERIRGFIERYFNLLTILFVVALVGGFLAMAFLFPSH